MASKRKIAPGDLVENINHPELDYRLIVSTGIATEETDLTYVEVGADWVTLALPGGESAPMPADIFKVVRPREWLEARAR